MGSNYLYYFGFSYYYDSITIYSKTPVRIIKAPTSLKAGLDNFGLGASRPGSQKRPVGLTSTKQLGGTLSPPTSTQESGKKPSSKP